MSEEAEQYIKLDDDIYQKICELCELGNEYAEQKYFQAAIEKFNQALDLIPEPYYVHNAATWILTAIGDTYFLRGDYNEARIALTHAMSCNGGVEQSFIHLRLGQAQFELGNIDRAQNELTLAYMGEGKEIFDDEDPKYFEHLKTILRGL